jgi:hypothetical protein
LTSNAKGDHFGLLNEGQRQLSDFWNVQHADALRTFIKAKDDSFAPVDPHHQPADSLTMNHPLVTPLERARAKLEQVERELKKCPDFQLYLVSNSLKDRARMKRLLMEIPNFRLWRTLANSIERAQRHSTVPVSMISTISTAIVSSKHARKSPKFID